MVTLMTGMRWALVGLILTVALAGSSAQADNPPPTLDDVITRYGPSILRTQWVDAGRLAVEIWDGQVDGTRLVALDADGNVQNLGPGGSAAVSPDGAFIVRRAHESWVVRETASDVERSLKLPPMDEGLSMTGPPLWSPDGTKLAFVFTRNPIAMSPPPRIRMVDGVRFIDVSADLNDVPAVASVVVVVDPHGSGAADRRLDVAGTLRTPVWGPDGRLYMTTLCFFGCASASPTTQILAWKPSEESAETVYRIDAVMPSLKPVPSPDGRKLALAADVDMGRWSDFVSLVVLDLSNGQLTRLSRDLRIDGSYIWSVDGTAVYATVRHGGFAEVHRYGLDGSHAVIVEGERRIFDLHLSPDGAMLSYQSLDGWGRHDIRMKPVYSDGAERVIYRLDDPPSRFQLGAFQQIAWPNGDGQDIFGFLILPFGFDPKRHYPLLVDIHGGGPGARLSLNAPLTSAIAPGPLEWHVWAAHGFVVFVPDYRSSGSYGPAPVAARYGEGDFAGLAGDVVDIEAGVRFLMAKGFVDQSRTALFGHSAGGARAALLLAQSDVFRAAVLNEAIPAGPLETFLSLATGPRTGSDFASVLSPMLGAPLTDDPSRYRLSHLLAGADSHVPTLILTGGDRRRYAVDPLSSEALFSILRHRRVPAKLLRFVEEGHVYRNPQAVKLAFHSILNWFEDHMSMNAQD